MCIKPKKLLLFLLLFFCLLWARTDPLQEILETGDYYKLLTASQASLLYKEEARGYFFLGKAYEGLDRKNLAEAAYQRTMTFPQKTMYFGGQIALYYEQKGDIEKAADVYRRLTELFPKDTQEVSVKLGQLYYDQKKYQDAIRTFSDIIFRDEKRANPLAYYVGLSYYALKNNPKAEEYFELARKHKYEDPDLLIKLGELKLRKTKTKEGIALMAKGIGESKTAPTAEQFIILGDAYTKVNSQANAAKAYRGALDQGRQDASLLLDYAIAATKAKEYQGVIDVLDPVIDKYEENGNLLFYLANANDVLENTEQAVQVYRKVLNTGYSNREYVRGRIRDLIEE